MNEYVDINTCATLLNDAWTVYLTFCGILVSIITLLYSFIMGKRNELYIYAEQSKLGSKGNYSAPLDMNPTNVSR